MYSAVDKRARPLETRTAVMCYVSDAVIIFRVSRADDVYVKRGTEIVQEKGEAVFRRESACPLQTDEVTMVEREVDLNPRLPRQRIPSQPAN